MRSLGIRISLGVLLWGFGLAAAVTPSPDSTPCLATEEIIQRVMDRSRALAVQRVPLHYTFRRWTSTEDLDAAGNIKNQKSKEHSIVVDGIDQTATLVKVNGTSLPENERQKVQRRETENREKFTSGSNGLVRMNGNLNEKLFRQFEYRLEGSECVDGRLAYVLTFQPTEETSGGSVVERILSKLQGRLWVDAAEFEPLRLEAQLTGSVSVGFFLAVLTELRIEVSRRRLPSGVWVEERVTTNAAGRKLIHSFRKRYDVIQNKFSDAAEALH